MKNTINRANHYVNEIAKLFNVSNDLHGKFKLLFAPANTIPDSDGTSIIDTYLVPVDQDAIQTVRKSGEQFLHLQILGSMIPADFLGYEFDFQVAENKNPTDPNVESSVLNVEFRDRALSKHLFHVLNTNEQ